jgi:hypothetical protein
MIAEEGWAAMNLYLQTRVLTQSQEDHLTCFVAAALATDVEFCRAYEEVVLAPLATGDSVPHIVKVDVQAAFPDQRSCPDMLLVLDDGRRVACEHKIEAPESLLTDVAEGEPAEQLRRYLRLPDIAALTYFRASLKAPPTDVLEHPRYVRPKGEAHFLWRDLYGPLVQGTQPISAWLREGFEQLGYTPPLAHIGELVTDDWDESHLAQVTFGKLWDATRRALADDWQSERGTSSTLFLTPRGRSLIDHIMLFAKAQKGSLLRISVKVRADEAPTAMPEVRRRLEAVAPTLPVPARLVGQRTSGKYVAVDLEASLHLILGDAPDPKIQEERLLAQVVPIAEAVRLR